MLHAQTPPGDDPWQTTHVVKTLWPPQPGTIQLRRVYGWQLICVRYRRDITQCYRYTTVELVVDHSPIKHRPVRRKLVDIPAEALGRDLLANLRALGGTWHAEKRVWQVDRRTAKGLGLLRKTRGRSGG